MHTDGTMRQLAERLINVAADPQEQKRREQLHGAHANPFSIFLDKDLQYRGASTTFYDYMHTWCIDGIFKTTFKRLQEYIQQRAKVLKEDFKPTVADLDAYMKTWTWPRQFTDARRIFESGEMNSGHASQILSGAPVIGKYFRDIVAPVAAGAGDLECGKAIDVFVDICDIIKLLAAAGRGHGEAEELRARTFKFMHDFLEVFGTRGWKLKFHLAMHVVLQWCSLQAAMREKGIPHPQLPNCFALEHKHKDSKKHMRDRCKGSSQERSVLEELLLDQLSSLKEGGSHGLVGLHPCNGSELADIEALHQPLLGNGDRVQVASQFKAPSGIRFHVGDVVCTVGGIVGQVRRFAKLDDTALVCLAVWRQLEWNDERRTGTYAVDGGANVRVVPCMEIDSAAIHKIGSTNAKTIWTRV